MQPPFHGTVEGFETEEIIATSNTRSRQHIGRPWKGDSEEQFQWEISLWERVFPRAEPPVEEPIEHW
eukprot:16020582-Heterocapsa_arctica.AAC.1